MLQPLKSGSTIPFPYTTTPIPKKPSTRKLEHRLRVAEKALDALSEVLVESGEKVQAKQTQDFAERLRGWLARLLS